MNYDPVAVKVWGDFAAFVRPELKAERVSYPCLTPSAARGILEAIFWKPEFAWRIREIHVLHALPSIFPGAPNRKANLASVDAEPMQDSAGFYQHFSIMRNEVDRRATETPISITESRTQRHSLILRDVTYVIYADVDVKPGVDEDSAKYRAQFRRRVDRGQCHSRPYLGCREFSCDFGPLDGREEALRFHHDTPIDLGLMLFDIVHGKDNPSLPLFFPARLEDGKLIVEPALYERFTG